MIDIKIAIADNSELFVEGLYKILNDLFPNTPLYYYYDGATLIHDLEKNQIDLVFMDIKMKPIDGFTASKNIKKSNPDCKVILLSNFNGLPYIEESLNIGVDGYILKDDASSHSITASIKKVINGGKYFSSGVSEVLLKLKKDDFNQVKSIILTPTEMNILPLLSDGLTAAKIGMQLHISDHTVDFYKRSLFMKFDAKNVQHLIKRAFEEGFLTVE